MLVSTFNGDRYSMNAKPEHPHVKRSQNVLNQLRSEQNLVEEKPYDLVDNIVSEGNEESLQRFNSLRLQEIQDSV